MISDCGDRSPFFCNTFKVSFRRFVSLADRHSERSTAPLSSGSRRNPSLRDLPNPQPQCRPRLQHALVAEGRDRQPRHTTCTPFAHLVGVMPITHHRAAPRGRHSFFASTSWSITFSSVNSATNRFRRPFSSWSCLNWRTWSVSNPLYCFFHR